MGFKLAELFVTVSAVTKPVEAQLARLKGQLGELTHRQYTMPGAGFTAALGLGLGAAAIGKMIKGAADLGETLSKVDQTFGQSAGSVKAYTDQMAAAFGTPKREMLDSIAMFGLIAQGMGKNEAESAKLGIRMGKLAADSASYFNADIPTALEKIRAGLTGESEPLKAWGVMMDEAAVKAKALELGLVKKGKELDNNAKLAARTALIEQGLKKAMGDLERTSGSAANQAKKFSGSLQNLGDTIGQSFLPAATKMITLLNEIITDLGQGAAAGQSSWGGFFKSFEDGIDAAGATYRNFADIIEMTGVMIGGWVLNQWEDIVQGAKVIAAAWEWTGKVLGEAFAAMTNMTLALAEDIKEMFSEVWDYIRSGGNDPIEVKFKPMLDGGGFQLPEFKLPEMHRSDVTNQLDAIRDRMNAREQERGAKQFDAQRKAADAAKAAAANAGATDGAKKKAPGSDEKNLITDADEYARDLAEAALKATDDKKLGAIEKCGDFLKEIRDNLSKINRPVAGTGLFSRG